MISKPCWWFAACADAIEPCGVREDLRATSASGCHPLFSMREAPDKLLCTLHAANFEPNPESGRKQHWKINLLENEGSRKRQAGQAKATDWNRGEITGAYSKTPITITRSLLHDLQIQSMFLLRSALKYDTIYIRKLCFRLRAFVFGFLTSFLTPKQKLPIMGILYVGVAITEDGESKYYYVGINA